VSSLDSQANRVDFTGSPSCGSLGERRLVVWAVGCEPVSTSYFPARQGIYREFSSILTFAHRFRPVLVCQISGFWRNSLLNGAGNFRQLSREFSDDDHQFAGNLAVSIGSALRWGPNHCWFPSPTIFNEQPSRPFGRMLWISGAASVGRAEDKRTGGSPSPRPSRLEPPSSRRAAEPESL
jgi:hypothetical protein